MKVIYKIHNYARTKQSKIVETSEYHILVQLSDYVNLKTVKRNTYVPELGITIIAVAY